MSRNSILEEFNVNRLAVIQEDTFYRGVSERSPHNPRTVFQGRSATLCRMLNDKTCEPEGVLEEHYQYNQISVSKHLGKIKLSIVTSSPPYLTYIEIA